ncbi:MAG TPA: 50S ribosomal protein L11 methyltransferase, partial [Micromonosporaceae bacterium]
MPQTPRVTLAAVPLVPEVSILQASLDAGLWDSSDGEYHSDQPPPFWAFAWAGGQALARYVLDHPEVVAGLSVLDLGAGSGLVAIAAAKAGARRVTACDTDPEAVAAARSNAEANGVRIEGLAEDLLAKGAQADVVLVGDLFYGPTMTNRVMRFLRRVQTEAGARVLVGDPGRGFLLPDRFTELASYDVPV